MPDEIPRRIRLDRMVPAELAITDAIRKIEAMGADVRLTRAQTLLDEARNLVADVVDGGYSEAQGASMTTARKSEEGRGGHRVCADCNDTHAMYLHVVERFAPCTSCPLPCHRCRNGLGAYCASTPCPCGCHAPTTPAELEPKGDDHGD